MRIAVLKLRCVKQKTSLIQILEHHRVCFLYKNTTERRIFCQISFSVHELYKRQIIAASHLRIVLTKRRGDMDDTRTVCQRYIGITYHKKRFLPLFCRPVCGAGIQRLVFLILQVFSYTGFQNLVSILTQYLIAKSVRHVIDASVLFHFYLYILLRRIHTERQVGRQRPRRSRPCQDVRVLVLHLEAHDCRTLLYILVALRHLLRGQRRTAARTVRNNLKAFIQKSFIPNLLQRPPLRLNIFIMVSNIRVIHIRPETYGS